MQREWMVFRMKRLSLKGFSLVELMIATVIFATFLMFIGDFFISGNKAASKGAWRNNAAAQLRLAMKVIQQGLDKTSYPTFTSSETFAELSTSTAEAAAFKVTFGGSTPLTPSTSLVYDGDSKGRILSFATAMPYQLRPDKSALPGSGITTQYIFSFDDNPPKKATTSSPPILLKTLYYNINGGNYTYDDATGSFSGVDTFGSTIVSNRPLLNDVHRISFSMLPLPANANIHKATIQIDIECRDPFDGRTVVSQSLLYMVNTDLAAAP